MSAASRLYPLPFLAVAILAGCSSQSGQPVSKGEKPVDVASVVRQKMPASVKDREAWAKDIATTFKSQGLAPTVEISVRCWLSPSRSPVIRRILSCRG